MYLPAVCPKLPPVIFLYIEEVPDEERACGI